MTAANPISDQMVIEPAAAEDIPRVVAIDEAISGAAKPEFWYHYFYHRSGRKSSRFLVARVGGEVAGYIIGSVRVWEFGSPPAGWIHAIGVDERFRKRGIATQLFQQMTAFFQSSGTGTVRTMLHIDDQRLMSFFRLQGLSAGPFIELEATID